MLTTPTQFHQWLLEPEGQRLEFKEAKQRYDFEKLLKYCVALANEGGGAIVLGVTDKRPRLIVGTQAFEDPGRTEAGLHQRLGHRIPVEELRLFGPWHQDRSMSPKDAKFFSLFYEREKLFPHNDL